MSNWTNNQVVLCSNVKAQAHVFGGLAKALAQIRECGRVFQLQGLNSTTVIQVKAKLIIRKGLWKGGV
jgi:hypothetical protein